MRREAVLSSQIEGTQSSQEYYRLLDLVRLEGDWEAWVDFFLEGVEQTASNAVAAAKRLQALFQEDERKVKTLGRRAATGLRVFHLLCRRPVLTLNQISTQVRMSFPSAAKGMEALVRLGIGRKLTGQRRKKVFAYNQYLAILQEGTELL